MHFPHRIEPKQAYFAGFLVGIGFIIMGVMTLYFPPEYYSHPNTWGFIFIYAGIMTIAALFVKSKIFAAIAGGFSVGASLFRSIAIFKIAGMDLLFDGAIGKNDLGSGVILFGTMWFLIATLLWVGWPVMAAGILRSGDDTS